jgi:hypothetical protein
MLPQEIILLTLPFTFFSYFKYIKSIFDGSNRPSVVSWFLWFAAPLFIFLATYSTGVSIFESFTVLSSVVCCLAVVLSCIIAKRLKLEFTKLDISCFALSIAGLLMWYFTKEPLWALIISLVVDFISGVPTILKSYVEPQYENPIVYLMGMITGGLNVLILKSFTIFSLAFPVYIVIISFVILLPLLRYRLLSKSN